MASCGEAMRRRARTFLPGVLRRRAAPGGDCDNADPPWHERQAHLLWHIVLGSGYVHHWSDAHSWSDAAHCMIVCRWWHACITRSSAYRRLAALRLVFDSGYVTQADAFVCMQVSSAWHRCVHKAPALWRRIDLRRWPYGVALPQPVHKGITDKRTTELVASLSLFDRRQLGALLRDNKQLRCLSFWGCFNMEALLALGQLRAPLHSLLVVNGDVGDELFARIVARAPKLKQLRELLAFRTGLGDGTARLLAAKFTRLHTLAIVDELVEDYPVSSAAVRHLSAKRARTRTTLRKLNLSEHIALKYSEAVAAGVLAMPNLEVFNMRYVGHGHREPGDWAPALKRRYEQKHGRPIRILGGFKAGLLRDDPVREYGHLAPRIFRLLTPQTSDDALDNWQWFEFDFLEM